MAQPLIYQLFDKEKADSIKSIYKDDISDDAKKSIQLYIGKELSVSTKIIVGNNVNQLILITSTASFCYNEEEPVQVAALIYSVLQKPNVLPKVAEDTGVELAAKCLVALSLFKPSLQKLCDQHGAPNPSYYEKVGKSALIREKMDNIAFNFTRWNNYLFEKFI